MDNIKKVFYSWPKMKNVRRIDCQWCSNHSLVHKDSNIIFYTCVECYQ